MDSEINEKAQVTIWIILAVALIFSLILFFALQENVIPEIINPTEFSPEAAIKQCADRYVEEAVDIMLPQGGFISPGNYLIFNETKVEYLCENVGFYYPCVNQHPVLIQEMEEEILNYITPYISDCFNDIKAEIEKRGNEIIISPQSEIILELKQDKVLIKINREVIIKEKDQTRTIPSFETEIENSAYNLAVIANEIASQEAKYCNFEAAGFSLTYPRYRVKEFSLSEPERVYTIADNKNGQLMMIAIRSCAIKPGV